jgi:AcrR family transcriptional regulator
MARRHPAKPVPQRRRRTGEEARTAILDAAERLLVVSGPAGIRLQEVARDVGVSHPTVLHHFGNREGLIEAVVARALDSLHAGLLAAVQEAPKGRDQVAAMLESVHEALVEGGHARAFLWLALSGYAPAMEHLRVRSLAEAVHETRRKLWKEKGKAVPPFEDTYFTVLLPALALLAMSATASPVTKGAKGAGEDDVCGPRRFRAWLGRMIHDHLEEG